MAKQLLAIALFKLAITIQLCYSTIEGPKEIDEWFQKLPYAKKKVTRLHFYFHDLTTGRNPSAVTVAQAPSTNQSSTFFGLINMMDDPLTEGPEFTSKPVGRAQGLYGSASQDEFGLVQAMNLVFTNGKLNGSTLTVLGRNAVWHPLREMTIVGGSGVFRMARGAVLLRPHFTNVSGGYAIVEYNVIAIHY